MTVFVAYSIHRPEVVALAEPHMRSCDCIVLEEPDTPGFSDMLAGRLDIADYLMGTDFDFPVFSTMMCELLRDLQASGIAVLQVDPYMEALASIHELFAGGGSSDDLVAGTLPHTVYRAERAWSGALLGFYRTSAAKEFPDVVEAVKRFGRTDAARGRLRDDLRAQAIAAIAGDYSSIYVEAGYVHVHLLAALRERVGAGVFVEPLHLMEAVVRRFDERGSIMSPGDALTVTYVYDPDYDGARADLQAARSLVRIKILTKEEIDHDLEGFPHTRDEVEASRLVRSLDYEECERLYADIRRLPTAQARERVTAYVAGKGQGVDQSTR